MAFSAADKTSQDEARGSENTLQRTMTKQSDFEIETSLGREITLETPPPDVVSTINACFEVATGVQGDTAVGRMCSPDSDSGQSGDSLFVTQRETPVTRTVRRLRRPSQSFLAEESRKGEEEEEEDRVNDEEVASVESERTHRESVSPALRVRKQSTRKRKLPGGPRNHGLSFPGRTWKGMRVTGRMNQILETCTVGGFFKCLKKISSGKKSALSVPPQKIGYMDEDDLEDFDEDVKVVEGTRFVPRFHLNNKKTWRPIHPAAENESGSGRRRKRRLVSAKSQETREENVNESLDLPRAVLFRMSARTPKSRAVIELDTESSEDSEPDTEIVSPSRGGRRHLTPSSTVTKVPGTGSRSTSGSLDVGSVVIEAGKHLEPQVQEEPGDNDVAMATAPELECSRHSGTPLTQPPGPRISTALEDSETDRGSEREEGRTSSETQCLEGGDSGTAHKMAPVSEGLGMVQNSCEDLGAHGQSLLIQPENTDDHGVTQQDSDTEGSFGSQDLFDQFEPQQEENAQFSACDNTHNPEENLPVANTSPESSVSQGGLVASNKKREKKNVTRSTDAGSGLQESSDEISQNADSLLQAPEIQQCRSGKEDQEYTEETERHQEASELSDKQKTNRKATNLSVQHAEKDLSQDVYSRPENDNSGIFQVEPASQDNGMSLTEKKKRKLRTEMESSGMESGAENQGDPFSQVLQGAPRNSVSDLNITPSPKQQRKKPQQEENAQFSACDNTHNPEENLPVANTSPESSASQGGLVASNKKREKKNVTRSTDAGSGLQESSDEISQNADSLLQAPEIQQCRSGKEDQEYTEETERHQEASELSDKQKTNRKATNLSVQHAEKDLSQDVYSRPENDNSGIFQVEPASQDNGMSLTEKKKKKKRKLRTEMESSGMESGAENQGDPFSQVLQGAPRNSVSDLNITPSPKQQRKKAKKGEEAREGHKEMHMQDAPTVSSLHETYESPEKKKKKKKKNKENVRVQQDSEIICHIQNGEIHQEEAEKELAQTDCVLEEDITYTSTHQKKKSKKGEEIEGRCEETHTDNTPTLNSLQQTQQTYESPEKKKKKKKKKNEELNLKETHTDSTPTLNSRQQTQQTYESPEKRKKKKKKKNEELNLKETHTDSTPTLNSRQQTQQTYESPEKRKKKKKKKNEELNLKETHTDSTPTLSSRQQTQQTYESPEKRKKKKKKNEELNLKETHTDSTPTLNSRQQTQQTYESPEKKKKKNKEKIVMETHTDNTPTLNSLQQTQQTYESPEKKKKKNKEKNFRDQQNSEIMCHTEKGKIHQEESENELDQMGRVLKKDIKLSSKRQKKKSKKGEEIEGRCEKRHAEITPTVISLQQTHESTEKKKKKNKEKKLKETHTDNTPTLNSLQQTQQTYESTEKKQKKKKNKEKKLKETHTDNTPTLNSLQQTQQTYESPEKKKRKNKEKNLRDQQNSDTEKGKIREEESEHELDQTDRVPNEKKKGKKRKRSERSATREHVEERMEESEIRRAGEGENNPEIQSTQRKDTAECKVKKKKKKKREGKEEMSSASTETGVEEAGERNPGTCKESSEHSALWSCDIVAEEGEKTQALHSVLSEDAAEWTVKKKKKRKDREREISPPATETKLGKDGERNPGMFKEPTENSPSQSGDVVTEEGEETQALHSVLSEEAAESRVKKKKKKDKKREMCSASTEIEGQKDRERTQGVFKELTENSALQSVDVVVEGGDKNRILHSIHAEDTAEYKVRKKKKKKDKQREVSPPITEIKSRKDKERNSRMFKQPTENSSSQSDDVVTEEAEKDQGLQNMCSEDTTERRLKTKKKKKKKDRKRETIASEGRKDEERNPRVFKESTEQSTVQLDDMVAAGGIIHYNTKKDKQMTEIGPGNSGLWSDEAIKPTKKKKKRHITELKTDSPAGEGVKQKKERQNAGMASVLPDTTSEEAVVPKKKRKRKDVVVTVLDDADVTPVKKRKKNKKMKTNI